VVSLFQEEYKEEAIQVLKDEVENRPWNLNVEYRQGNFSYATLVDTSNSDEDIAKTLIRDGLLLLENRREKKLQKLVRRLLKHFILIIQ
jgi:staphylococcal nuclease domain-containing protein 1